MRTYLSQIAHPCIATLAHGLSNILTPHRTHFLEGFKLNVVEVSRQRLWPRWSTYPFHIDYRTIKRSDAANMGLSKSTRIMILLGIDSVFFLLELVVGYAVHSLALVADSFHMVRRPSFVLERTVTKPSAAKRCHFAPRRTLGSKGRERKDQLEEVYIRGTRTTSTGTKTTLTRHSGNAQRRLVRS